MASHTLNTSRESIGRTLLLRNTKAKLEVSSGSTCSLDTPSLNKIHWRGSAFDIPHNSLVDVSEIRPLPENLDISKVPWWTSKRFTLAVICFFGSLSLEATRVNLSIAIVSMVDNEPTDLQTNNSLFYNTSINSNRSTDLKCPVMLNTHTKKGEFRWSKELQGIILGSFFWGYLALQVCGGWFSEQFGAKKVIAVGMFSVSIVTVLSPVCARASPYFLIAIRILLGLGQCVFYPGVQTVWMRWAPPHERSRLAGIAFAGSPVGDAVMFPIGGFLSRYGFDGGWPSVFYVIGTACFIWTVIWCLATHDRPGDHPSISHIERQYIEYSLGIKQTTPIKKIPTPWKSIFKSKAVWAIVTAHVTANFGNYMLSTQLPTYMKDVLHFDIEANGLFSMLPYLLLWMMMLVSGTIADILIMKKYLSIVNTRKLMTSIGTILPGIFLIGTSYMECDQQLVAVVMLTLGIGFCGFHMSGFFMNTTDIAPAFAGTLIGISNSAATIPGIISPYVAGLMTANGTREEWQATFYIAAAIYFFGAIFYCIFADGDIQSWGHVSHHEDIVIEETVALSLNNLSTELQVNGNYTTV